MALKVAMHNWMRPEPIETTISRLARAGYDGIEIAGEPAVYDAGRGALAARGARARVLGLGHDHGRRPRPPARGPLRPHRLDPVLQGHDRPDRRARREDADRRPVHGREDRPDGLARGRVAVGDRQPEGGQRLRRGQGRPARARAAEPLRDVLPEPPRPGARARGGRRRQLRRLPRHLPHEHRGGRLGAGAPDHVRGRQARRRPRGGQQPHARAARARSTGRRSSARSRRSATTTT